MRRRRALDHAAAPNLRWRPAPRRRWTPRPGAAGLPAQPEPGQIDRRRGTRCSRCCRGWRCRARRRARGWCRSRPTRRRPSSSGTALMISLVAGAAVRLMPVPSTAKATAITKYGVVGVSMLSMTKPAGDDHEAGRHHTARHRSGPASTALRGDTTTNDDRERQQREAGLQRRVAAARTAGTASRGRRSRTSRRTRS